MKDFYISPIGRIEMREGETFVVLEPEFISGLKALDGFSHLNVLSGGSVNLIVMKCDPSLWRPSHTDWLRLKWEYLRPALRFVQIQSL